jgi:sensor histidine kinase YesM
VERQAHRITFRNIGIALIGIWLAIVLYSYLFHLTGVLTVFGFMFRPWDMIRGATLYLWAPWLLMAPVVYYLAWRFPIRPGGGFKVIVRHVLLMSLLAVLHAFAASMLYYHIGDFEMGMEQYAAWQHTGHYLFTHNNFYLLDAFVYCVLIASISVKHFYELARQKELDAERSQTQLVESRLQTLKMQVNPHFLFNTLNSIAVLIRKQDNAGAEQMLNRLSDFFRLTLEQGEEQLVTVTAELKLIRQYLEIEKVRFGERLDVDFQVDDDCLEASIPVLILQPLVENAIRHGLGKKPGKCRLQISIRNSAEGIRLSVTDDGAGIAEDRVSKKGVGLSIIRSRLAALYADNARFTFSSEPGKGASANILVPAEKAFVVQV